MKLTCWLSRVLDEEDRAAVRRQQARPEEARKNAQVATEKPSTSLPTRIVLLRRTRRDVAYRAGERLGKRRGGVENRKEVGLGEGGVVVYVLAYWTVD